jgi:hypothetical protein
MSDLVKQVNECRLAPKKCLTMCKKVLLDPMVIKVSASDLAVAQKKIRKDSPNLPSPDTSPNTWNEPYKNCRLQYHIFQEGRKNVVDLLDFLSRREDLKKREKLKKLKINPCQTYMSYTVI